MSDLIKIDARGEQCPIPVVKAKKALDHARVGDTVEVHVDNDIAVQNLSKMAKSQNCPSTSEELDNKHYVVRIELKGDGNALEGLSQKAGGVVPGQGGVSGAGGVSGQSGAAAAAMNGVPAQPKKTVAVIDSATMGRGDEALGKVLMKGFLYALSQLDELPAKVLFYNSGINLTTEGSDSLEDLKYMQEQGVEIFSCGTCLDFYNRKELLRVGEISNMYQIVQAMAEADHLIRP